jgi:hypothetical protein
LTAQEDTMSNDASTTTGSAEGWIFPHAAAKKAHYIRRGLSLCGRWGYLGHGGMDPKITPTPGLDDCKACWRKRDAEREGPRS